MSGNGFRHEAMLYAGEAGFLDGTSRFIRQATDRREPILVVVDAAKITALRARLGGAADRVEFADMAEVGQNPARIIPAWQSFVERHGGPGRRLWGVGEPIWPGRTPIELVECRQHEALLNVAFGDAGDFRLMCPYDAAGLDPAVIDAAHRTHPLMRAADQPYASRQYAGVVFDTLLREPLPAPPADAAVVRFGPALGPVRHFAASEAVRAGWERKAGDVALAVAELTTNSVRHGGGEGTLAMWCQDARLVCEVRDRGTFTDPLVGRRRPRSSQFGGRGLWLVNQVSDLVQIRAGDSGSTIRIHFGPR